MVGHEDLGPLGYDQVGGRNTLLSQVAQLLGQPGDVQGHAVSDDVCHMGIKDSRGQDMQGKAAMLVEDGVPRVGPPLKADHHV